MARRANLMRTAWRPADLLPAAKFLTPTLLTTGGSPNNVTSVVTASISWSAGDLVVVAADINYLGTNATWTCTVTGLTFNLKYSTSSNGNKMHLWEALAGSSGSGAITLGGDSTDAYAYLVAKFTPTGGTVAAGAVTAGAVTAGTTNSVTGLTGYGVKDYLYALTMIAADSVGSNQYSAQTGTPRANWTEIGEALGSNTDGWAGFVHAQLSPQGGEATASITGLVSTGTTRMIVLQLTLT